MKSKLILLLCISLFICVGASVFASAKHMSSRKLYSISLLKDTSFAENIPSLNDNLRRNEINIHALRHFRKSFSFIKNDRWFKINNGFMVTFIYDAMRSQVYYDTRGIFLGMTRSYTEDQLPTNIRSAIKQQYRDYLIDVVSEVSKNEELFYLIKIKNSRSIKTLEIANGRIEVIEDLVNGGIWP